MALTGLEAAALAAQTDGTTRSPSTSWRTPCSATPSSTTVRGTPTTTSSARSSRSIRGSDPDAALFWLAPDDRGGGGPPVHRAAADRARLRGRRAGGPDGAPAGDAPPPTRSSTWACPRRASTSRRPRSTWPGRPKSNAVITRARRRTRGRAVGRPRPGPPARRVATAGREARPREGLPVPARLPGPPRRAAVPARRYEGGGYYEPSDQGEEGGRGGPAPALPRARAPG